MEESYFEYNRTQLDFPRGIFNTRKIRLIHGIIRELPRLSNVLDAGCGAGIVSGGLLDDYQIYGIDAKSQEITYCKTNYPKGRYVLADLEESLPFSDAFFDGIVFSETIEHLPNPDKALIELKRVLKKKGIIIITTPNYDSLKWRIIERIWYPVFGGNCTPMHEDVHPSKFGRKKLHNILIEHFRQSQIGTFNYGMWLFAISR